MMGILYIGKGIRFVVLPEACCKTSGGYWRENIYHPKVGCYYGYREPINKKWKEVGNEK